MLFHICNLDLTESLICNIVFKNVYYYRFQCKKRCVAIKVVGIGVIYNNDNDNNNSKCMYKCKSAQ